MQKHVLSQSTALLACTLETSLIPLLVSQPSEQHLNCIRTTPQRYSEPLQTIYCVPPGHLQESQEHFFGTFWRLRAGRPGKTCGNFFRLFGPEGLETPVFGRQGRKPYKDKETFCGGQKQALSKLGTIPKRTLMLPEPWVIASTQKIWRSRRVGTQFYIKLSTHLCGVMVTLHAHHCCQVFAM